MQKNKELSLNPSEIDYSQFGGEPVDAEPQNQEPEIDYSQFGGEEVDYSQFGGDPVESEEPKKEKVGKFKSALLGLYEGVVGIPGVIQLGINELSKGVEEAYYGEKTPDLGFEKENPIISHLSNLPESEDQTSRRIRVGAQALPASVLGGVPGVVAGLVGSQAGQTVREVYGKDGKFEEFGLGEAAAIGADLFAGFGAAAASSIIRQSTKTAANAATKTPSIFTNPKTGLQRKIVQNAIQSEENALHEVIKDFGKSQLKNFEEEISKVSPQKFTDLNSSNASAIQQQTENMFKNTQLSIISPIEATPQQGGRAIQDAANATFQTNVIEAERKAYSAAKNAAQGLKGTAPKSLKEAKKLRASLTVNEPTPEQKSVINFLDGFIADLETNTPASKVPASKILDSKGNPITAASETPASSKATVKRANDLVELVQSSNQAVNYGAEVRLQSHRLKPLIKTLREEVGAVLGKKAEAQTAYQTANNLHARNSDIWGTKYMKNVRFSENPENIVQSSTKASNLRNLKQGIQDPTIQGLAERQVVENVTKGGGAKANRNAIKNLNTELSPQAQGAANEIINVKDPLTTVGGRAAVGNEILKDAAQAVNTGKKPAKILGLMKTPKGYQIVKETLDKTPESRKLLKSFERLFLEDVMSSFVDESGFINFGKAKDIFKNPEIKKVVNQISGDKFVKRIEKLEKFAQNFEKNKELYSNPVVQSMFKQIVGEAGKAAPWAFVLHSLHMPWPVIAGLGLAKVGGKVAKVTYKNIEKKILSNPKLVHYLEKLSEAKNVTEVSKQLPRLVAEMKKIESDEEE